ncbi:MAG: amino acid adenylation domain-containing protein, partial [Desulfobacterales bacterium]|nr:amino acid adenylation domain-containing protein [Desulfobacterales bacterium]
WVLEDSGAALLITGGEGDQRIRAETPTMVLDEAALGGRSAANPPGAGSASDLLYILYTSGTTGKPKGVMIEHENVVRLLFNDRFPFDFDETDVWTMFHGYYFDFSVWEMYGALLTGGRLVVVPARATLDPRACLEILRTHDVTVLNQTPSAFYNLAREESKRAESDLKIRWVIFGGEKLAPGELKGWRSKYPRARLVNMYGITEITVHGTFKEIGDREIETDVSNIGKPIPTTTAYIMDRNLNLQPIGVYGELCVGGKGVARGYVNLEALTREKFTPNPHVPGEIIYRSGDYARVLDNGEMEYRARIDHQVQIRGFRVEPGEIEVNLRNIEGVTDVVVMEEREGNAPGSLCAWLTVERAFTVNELKALLSESLPDYMIPDRFVEIDAIPLTPNGKVDRRALASMNRAFESGAAYQAPGNETEEALLHIWKAVLNRSELGVHDNFFDVGGNSLLLIRLHSHIEERFSSHMRIVDLFTQPTIRKLARFMDRRTGDGVWKIPSLALPDDFFHDRPREGRRSSAIDFTVRDHLFDQLAAHARRRSIRIMETLLSLYMYSLYEITGRDEIAVQTMMGRNDRIMPLALDFGAIEEIDDLHISVSKALDGGRRGRPVEEIKHVHLKREASGARILVYDKRHFTSNIDMDGVFDLQLRMDEQPDAVDFTYRFSETIRAEKVKGSIETYFKMIDVATREEGR